jgi:hypothetical protein
MNGLRKPAAADEANRKRLAYGCHDAMLTAAGCCQCRG